MLLLIIIISLLPGFAWLFFFLREDPHPEPPRLLLLTFFMGILFAIVALFAENAFNLFFPALNIQNIISSADGSFNPIFMALSLSSLAFIEEIAKFAGAYFAIHKNPEFDEPIDAMIYVMVSALGFATLENLGALNPQSAHAALLPSILQIASLRFVGATLLHSLTASLIGYYWALGIRQLNVKKYLAWGILFATVLHAVFNYFILEYGNISYTLVFLVIVGFYILNDFEKLKVRTI
jgi:RsiW-degrading membrane proteinase PrsW (M82 family)